MRSEVGPNFNPNDPETIAGLCETREQRRKTGYVNDPADAGGETKFGISAAAEPDVNIKRLTLAEAKEIYFRKYWLGNRCDQLPDPLNILHFDCAVNSGSRVAGKTLQRALGFPESQVDGIVGPATLSAAASADIVTVAKTWLQLRRDFYQQIVKRNPTQAKFLNGWLARVDYLKAVTIDLIS